MPRLSELETALAGGPDRIQLARELCAEAAKATERARNVVGQSRRRRAEWREWRAMWSAYCRQPGTFLSCCAYCARMRTGWGDWVSIPGKISEWLLRTPTLNLSHGFCPECLVQQAPEQPNRRPLSLVS